MIEITPKIEITEDGSHTMKHPILGDFYHSTHGAETESMHVFIKNGLELCDRSEINVLEIGFGTGLNALLTMQYAIEKQIKINYTTLELYPISIDAVKQLSFSSYEGFIKLHEAPWGKIVQYSPYFYLQKLNLDLADAKFDNNFDIIYFDAFSPDTQPELWSEDIFKEIYNHTSAGGALVTYSAKGDVKRALRAAGFTVKRLPGAPGKRHMLRATK